MVRKRHEDDEPRIWAIRDRTKVAPQTSLARTMRSSPTMAEKKLWWHLHRLSVAGSHFRRQVRLGRYIADFASHKARLVIEVDGGQHAENAADVERTKFIEGQGYRVLRFWNNEVLGNVEGVLEVIQAAASASVGSDAGLSHRPCREARGRVPDGAASTQLHHPHPHPLPTRGRGGDRGEGEP
jgi:very-short-patch-repair endonuclease